MKKSYAKWHAHLYRVLFLGLLAVGFGTVAPPSHAQRATVVEVRPVPTETLIVEELTAESQTSNSASVSPATETAAPSTVVISGSETAGDTVHPAETPPSPEFNHGDTAWMLTSTLLVLLMIVPGLALFYGGLVRAKNVLSVLSQVLVVLSLVLVLWFCYGYSAVFSKGNALFGSFIENAFLRKFTADSVGNTPVSGIPDLLFVAFQSTFAGITTCLIVGGFAERVKFRAVLLFSVIWFTFSYIPMAHIVWGGGFLHSMGAIDFAGGTVVHINAGVAGLAGAYFVGKRIGFGREALKPHSVPLTYIGAMLLWIGWFGFNAGSAGGADTLASLALINTLLATAAAVLGWTLVEALGKGKPSALGAASGAVAGLVGVTPACGTVGPVGALVIGLVCGMACVWGVNGLKRLLKVDDTADVFGVHGVGGIIGALLSGLFSAKALGGTIADLAIGHQLAVQLLSVVVALVWSAIVTFAALYLVKVLVGVRVNEESERTGLDISTHGESAYEV